MRRKIIQLAGKTLVVSLPVKWAREQKIKKGDELELELGENQINISTEGRKKKLNTSIFLDCNEEFAKRRINTLYKRGIDEIDLTANNSRIINAVQDEIKTLIGYEIINRTERACRIKNIAQPMEEELENLINRVFLINLEMTKLIEKLIQKREEETLNELKGLEEMNNKLTNLCKRILNKKNNERMEKTNLTYCILWGLEKLSDEYKRLGEEIYNKKTNWETTRILAGINAFYRAFYGLYSKFNEKIAVEFSEEYSRLVKESKTLIKTNPLIGHHAYNIVRQIYELAGPYYATML